ncbi:hypothetical protein ASZ90_010716 [hydrocarbon metagenome]|uniref:Uncharacterized protein n=1 Tax=hydrocarbon metagenome TaxID=938273 RepID=A0A0W8FF72_9ZZZZ
MLPAFRLTIIRLATVPSWYCTRSLRCTTFPRSSARRRSFFSDFSRLNSAMRLSPAEYGCRRFIGLFKDHTSGFSGVGVKAAA